MKKIIIALAATLAVGAVSAADLSSVGSTGKQATAGYTFADVKDARVTLNGATVGGQLNFGAKGSVALDVGAARVDAFGGDVTNEIATLTYANGGTIGALDVVGSLGYTRYNALKNGTNVLNIVSAGVEAQLNDVSALVTPFVGYNFSHVFTTSNAVSLGGFGNSVTAGAYVNLSKSWNVKVGYQHGWQSGLDTNGAIASVSYKF